MFAIAYSDRDGSDFAGLPWILGCVEKREDCILIANQLEKEGYRDIVPFEYQKKSEFFDEFSWDYVREHRIK